MKKIFLLAVIAIFTITVQAQNEKYVAFMKKNITALDTSRTNEDLQNAANNFERIANAENGEWLPNYYAAYALVRKAYNTKDLKEVDPICDKADAFIAMAESLSPNNSEIATLKAMVLTARMQVDGSRGMTMGPKATMILQAAMNQAPQGNPRLLVQMSQMLFYTPEAFGGGKKAGIEVLQKGIAAYDTFKPATEIDPNWGKAYAENLLKGWTAAGK